MEQALELINQQLDLLKEASEKMRGMLNAQYRNEDTRDTIQTLCVLASSIRALLELKMHLTKKQ